MTHTKGKLEREGSYLVIRGTCFIANVVSDKKEWLNNADRLALCWNNHDKLVEALEATKALNLHHCDEGTVGKRVYDLIEKTLKDIS
jgi:hypothetical protein